MSSLPIPNLPPRPLGPRRGILESRRKQILQNESSKLEEEDQRLQERLDTLRQHLDQQKQRFNAMQGSSFWKSGGKHSSLSHHAQSILEEKRSMLKKYNLDEKLEAFLPPPPVPPPSAPLSSPSFVSKPPNKLLRPVGSATTRKTWNVPIHSQTSSTEILLPTSSRFQLPFTELGLPSLQSKHVCSSVVLHTTASGGFEKINNETEKREGEEMPGVMGQHDLQVLFKDGHQSEVKKGLNLKEQVEQEEEKEEEQKEIKKEEMDDQDGFDFAILSSPFKVNHTRPTKMIPFSSFSMTQTMNECSSSLTKATSCLELNISEPQKLVRPSTCSTHVQVKMTGSSMIEKSDSRSSKVLSDFNFEFTKELSLLDQWLLRELKKTPPPPPPSSSDTTTTCSADLISSTYKSDTL